MGGRYDHKNPLGSSNPDRSKESKGLERIQNPEATKQAQVKSYPKANPASGP